MPCAPGPTYYSDVLGLKPEEAFERSQDWLRGNLREPPIRGHCFLFSSSPSKHYHCNSLPSGSRELMTLQTAVAPVCQAKYHLMAPYIMSLITTCLSLESISEISAEIRGCLNFHWWPCHCHCLRSPMLVKAVGKLKSQFKRPEIYSHNMSLEVSFI